jgi:hypothetical protein
VSLITREEFLSQVFERDSYTCVVPGCTQSAVDPHHILERRLFCEGDPLPGGYDVDNGASLCEIHHIHAEKDYFPPQALRRWIGITNIVLPVICNDSCLYDKWGNIIDKSPRTYVKYPKTPYLNFSPSYSEGDRYIDTKNLLGKPLQVSLKRDGSCVTMSRDVCGARNAQSADHYSFNMFKQRHAIIRHRIPTGIQLFGEWLYAKHSIHYSGSIALKDYLEIFAVYDQQQQLFLGHEEMLLLCKELNLTTANSLASFSCHAEWELINKITSIAEKVIEDGEEGIVVKSMYPFHYSHFSMNVAKYVRSGFVAGNEMWNEGKIIKNEVLGMQGVG